jgi:septal ring factor EnvC (AmiA/AmiB activator)
MSDHDFQSTVLTALADLKTEQAETRTEVKNIVSRLDRLNGKVADHEARIGQMQIELAERRKQCPLVDAVEIRIRPLEEALAVERAVEQNTKNWMDHIWPIVWIAAGVFGLLILEHAAEIKKALFH